jgi:DNA-binding transcriptional MerR regulator
VTPPDTYFDLPELADRAGVTARTVRYYIQQGLLPAPEARGPLTRYTAAHLDRLQLIRRLQREHLPLAEIRQQLEAMDDAAVRHALARAPKKEPRSAAEYVREVLGKSRRTHHVVDRSAPLSPLAEEAMEYDVAATRQALHAPLMQKPPESRSTWERIALAPDIELHVRRPLSREQNRQLERLLEAAREILSDEK